ncbi:MAG: peptide ABC transporter permease [Chloroflexi bacterium RBG_19FT_COMBO_62_14]|nr:MAG: peptide ABC transporter permease [Chloroflexi bacterium RBG_19FT_COMBO_62_14]
MSRYLVRRLGFVVLTVFLTSIVIFSVIQVLPGDVARVILGREAGQAAVDQLRQELGLDLPAPVRYLRWIADFVRGAWGESFSLRTAVLPLVARRLSNSLLLAAVVLGLAVPLSVGLGVMAGLRQDSFLDNVVSMGSLALVGLPEFVTGLVLIQVFALQLGLFPASSSLADSSGLGGKIAQLILPSLTAALVLLGYLARLTRAQVIEESGKPYVRTAVLKGLPRRTVILRHILRNALMPTVTVVAISFGWLLSGLIVIEAVFNYPGLGSLLVFAVSRRDLPVIQAISMLAVVGYALANLSADLVYAALNPRLRLE